MHLIVSTQLSNEKCILTKSRERHLVFKEPIFEKRHRLKSYNVAKSIRVTALVDLPYYFLITTRGFRVYLTGPFVNWAKGNAVC